MIFVVFHEVFAMLKCSKCPCVNEIMYCTLMSYTSRLLTVPFLRKTKYYIYVPWEVGILYLCYRAVWLDQYRVLLAFRWPVRNSAWTHSMLTETCTDFSRFLSGTYGIVTCFGPRHYRSISSRFAILQSFHNM